ncbi:MAG: hypothetical protein ACYDA8_05830 [Deferrisomatales bacterium]
MTSAPYLPSSYRPVAVAYARLEARVRMSIDALGRRVCPGCPSPCCRVQYCRATARNPWYAFVAQAGGLPPLPADWAERRDPFGLAADGCWVRAGRYVFCYSYNCRRLLEALPAGAPRRAFQDLSDLLLVPNRLPAGRLLHELGSPGALGLADVESIGRAVVEAEARLPRLEAALAAFIDPTPPPPGRQAHGRYPCPEPRSPCRPVSSTAGSTRA